LIEPSASGDSVTSDHDPEYARNSPGNALG
jgi:hypothetical protein